MWTKIKAFFLDSESIFLARLQVLAGVVLGAIQTTDPNVFSSIVGAKWFPVFLLGWGILSEYARRRRVDMKSEAGTPDDEIRGV